MSATGLTASMGCIDASSAYPAILLQLLKAIADSEAHPQQPHWLTRNGG
jgi:hypothetical protein